MCSAEACSFRDSYEVFRDAGAEVIGISSGFGRSRTSASPRGFACLSCFERSGMGWSASAIGVAKTLGILPGRTTYVIDREGVIRHIFSSQFLPAKHVSEALSVLTGCCETRLGDDTAATSAA